MEQITQEVIKEASLALAKDDYIAFFEAFGFNVTEDVCVGNVDKANAIEIENYTDAGGDMLIDIIVTEDWRQYFREYVEDFDINEEVAIWWPNGVKGRGVPFDNVKEHYDDLKDWLDWLKDVVRIMDGKELQEEEKANEEATKILEAQLEAVRKWCYWQFNYFEPAKVIREVWGTGPFADHMLEKLYSYKNNFCRFYVELDKECQRKLATYVMQNYNT